LRESIPSDHEYRFIIHDHDAIFSAELSASLTRLGLEVITTPRRSPQANSLCERLIGTLRRECLDWIIPLSEGHLKRVLRSWMAHYNRGRPHSSLGPGIPDPWLGEPRVLLRLEGVLRCFRFAASLLRSKAKLAWTRNILRNRQVVVNRRGNEGSSILTPARHSRFGYLKHRAPDLPPLSDQRIVHRDPFRGYVFPKLTEWKGSREFLFPPTQVLDRVSVEGFIGPAVGLTVRLLVSFDIHATSRNSTDYGDFPDSAFGGTTLVLELTHTPHVN
jgi:hypothetical protein